MKGQKNATITLVDSNVGTRDSVRNILQNNGFRNITSGLTYHDLDRSCQAPVDDLLIVSIEMEDGDVCELIRRLRHSEIGNNPFVPVIGLITHPSATLVRAAVDAGIDHLVTVPISTKQFLDRIDLLINKRKSFVVTSDYIGPDRRKTEDRETTVPLINAPNSLKAKVTGDTASLQNAIEECVQEVNLQKLERHAFQMMWLVDKITEGLTETDSPEKLTVPDNLERLHYVSQDTSRRLAGTKYAHVSDLCEALVPMVEEVQSHESPLTAQEFKLLAPLTQAIQLGFKTGVAAKAQQIIAAVQERRVS